MPNRNLGEEMNVAVFAILDLLDEAGAARLHKMVIERIGMTPVMAPAVWRYPVLDMGGTGETIAAPCIYAQPLAESLSLTVTDSWHEHRGYYLIICSCRPFNAAGLWRWLKKKGWKVVDCGTCRAELVEPPQSWIQKLLRR